MLSVPRVCVALTESGAPCRQAPLSGANRCFWHDPAHAEEAAEARRLGGLRRRRERAAAGSYDFEGLASVTGIRRLLEVAVLDTLELDNSIARARTLAYLAMVAAKLLTTGELEERIVALEAATQGQAAFAEPALDGESDELALVFEPADSDEGAR